MSQVQEGQLTDEKLKPGELTQEQLALLNNLMYLKHITANSGRTLGEYLGRYRKGNYAEVDKSEGAADTTHEDCKNRINTVK